MRPLADALETIPDLKWVKESKDPKIRTLVDASLVLEGMNRNAGDARRGRGDRPRATSATTFPSYKTPQTEVMTQYNMKDLETAGLLKMDFLGLRTLTVIENALQLIRENHGIDDRPRRRFRRTTPRRSASFSRGDTVGVFQFESRRACRTGSGS